MRCGDERFWDGLRWQIGLRCLLSCKYFFFTAEVRKKECIVCGEAEETCQRGVLEPCFVLLSIRILSEFKVRIPYHGAGECGR